MIFENYWKRLVQQNPGLATESTKVAMTVSVFKEAIRKAFQEGEAENRRTMEAAQKLAAVSADPLDNIFRGLSL